MTWRDEAKVSGVALYDYTLGCTRKKVDVLAEIEAKRQPQEEAVKITINVKEANRICKDALFNHITEQGFNNVICERYVESACARGKFLNCKRKGIIFKGKPNGDTELIKTEVSRSEGRPEGEHVSEGGQE